MKKVFILCKDFTVGDTTDAERLLLEYKPAYISIFGEIEPPRKLHFFVAGKERNVTSQRVDKGTSLSFIVEFENADVEQCIVAGDSTPDIPMLTFEGIGKRIQVKRQGLVENDDTTEYVENARELGKYILHFIKDNKL
jgi:hydroxymethylpyrimidine pyrophosphatase-like HAD family hydrolase